jgi:DNA-binding NarL/FixJ family response regulator
MSEITVLLVDDQAMVRAGFEMMLDSQPDLRVVGGAGDGAEALEQARLLRPDVVIMDVRMPRMDGVEATRRLGEMWPDGGGPRVLILTTFDLDEYVYDAIRAGASGFLLKDAPPEDLVDAVRVVAAGDALLAPSVTRRLLDEFAARPAPGAPEAALAGAGLTERELEVLRGMARGRTNAEIAEELYLGEATVKTHVSRVLSKLGLRDRVQAVVFAYENGVVRVGD